MTFDDWLAVGIRNGFCGPPVCATHDGVPSTAAEDAEFEDGFDPCVTVIRPYEDVGVRREVELNHSPSTWRK